MKRNCANVVSERVRVLADLRQLGFLLPDSVANFVWLPFGEISSQFAAHCRSNDIDVMTEPDVGVRVSISTPAQNNRFLRAAAVWAADISAT
jgi:histidinol-phosphate aminotransferase